MQSRANKEHKAVQKDAMAVDTVALVMDALTKITPSTTASSSASGGGWPSVQDLDAVVDPTPDLFVTCCLEVELETCKIDLSSSLLLRQDNDKGNIDEVDDDDDFDDDNSEGAVDENEEFSGLGCTKSKSTQPACEQGDGKSCAETEGFGLNDCHAT